MSNAPALSAKLTAEGERTLAFFCALPEPAWRTPVYDTGAHWNVRQVLEHLAIAEQNLCRICRQIDETGVGAAEDFDINAFNAANTDTLASWSLPQLLGFYTEQRANTAAFAATLSEAQLAKRGRHPAMGHASIEEILKMMYLHNTMHLKDIKRVLADRT